MSVDSDSKSDDSGSKPPSPLPHWIPRWMSERERAAFVIALGLVAAALILIGGAFGLLSAAGYWPANSP